MGLTRLPLAVELLVGLLAGLLLGYLVWFVVEALPVLGLASATGACTRAAIATGD